MEKPLTMMFLVLGGLIAATLLVAMVYPAVARTGNAIASERAGASDESREEIRLVNAFSELDGAGSWQDVDADTYFDAWVWVKNTGETTVQNIAEMDLFLDSGGSSARIPHATDAGAAYPRWTYAVEQGGAWQVGSTLRITVHYSSALATGEHVMRVVTSDGAEATGAFTF